MHKLLATLGLAAALVLPAAVQAQTGAVVAGAAPGKAGAAEVVKLTATITAIDKAARDVTVKGPQGNEVTLTAGPEVKNFDQMKVGDAVNVEFLQALTLELKKGGGLVVARTEQKGGAAAKPGEKPAAAVGKQVTIVADVIAVDPAKQTITLKGPKQTVDMRIPDPVQFKRIAKGDQVEAVYTQAVALAVTPAAKK